MTDGTAALGGRYGPWAVIAGGSEGVGAAGSGPAFEQRSGSDRTQLVLRAHEASKRLLPPPP